MHLAHDAGGESRRSGLWEFAAIECLAVTMPPAPPSRASGEFTRNGARMTARSWAARLPRIVGNRHEPGEGHGCHDGKAITARYFVVSSAGRKRAGGEWRPGGWGGRRRGFERSRSHRRESLQVPATLRNRRESGAPAPTALRQCNYRIPPTQNRELGRHTRSRFHRTSLQRRMNCRERFSMALK